MRWTADYLAEKGFEDARLNAELLLAGVLGLKRLDLYLQFERPLSPDELAEFKRRLRRRLRREPIQYIEGRADFRKLTLRADRRGLVPRPETEILVGEVLAWAEGRNGLEVLDVGTGSGAIALSLAQEGRFGRVVATDASPDALDLTRANLELLGVGQVELREGSLYQPVTGETFDIIVSNPPYVADGERTNLPPEVADWEPPAALYGGADGLEVIRPLLTLAPGHLRGGGLLAVEIGADQASAVLSLLGETGAFRDVRVRRDLAGRDRIVMAERIGSPRSS